MLIESRFGGTGSAWGSKPIMQGIGNMAISKIKYLANGGSLRTLAPKLHVTQVFFYRFDHYVWGNRIASVKIQGVIPPRQCLPPDDFDPIFHEIDIGNKNFFPEAGHDGGMTPLNLYHLAAKVFEL